jgi:site-specific DNA recombinase
MNLSQYKLLDSQGPQTSPTTRYIIYCRKSSESDERQIQSLSDQINTLLPFVQQRGLKIVGEPLQESKSAKSPGRPLFNQMVSMIEQGEANGIILLNPTRLSRNTVDTGQIIFLMDLGKLVEVVTPFQTFKNNPNDKFMLNLLCTQAKLENDNKSVTVRDSMRLKAERGDFPGIARPGYINNRLKHQGQRDISAHPVYFSLMRKFFDFALTGSYSLAALTKKADEMGIRKYNGKVIGKTSIHRMLQDPFYTGRFMYTGKLYNGNHPAMLTDDVFNHIQNILDGKANIKKQKHTFALNGTIICGECKYCVTAEAHTKKYKNGTAQTFGYYRCSKQSKKIKCSQGYLAQLKAETQVKDDLSKLELEREFAQWAYEALDEVVNKEQTVTEDKHNALQNALDGVNKRISNLVDLKISPDNADGSLLSDEEFAERKRSLLGEKEKLLEQIKKDGANNSEWGVIAKESFDFGLQAKNKFKKDVPEDQKDIAKTIYSNLILLDQNLQFQPRYLFIKYKKGVEQTNAEKTRFEPEKSLLNQTKLEFSVKNDIWYTWRDSNPRPLRPKRSALIH